MHSTTPVMRNKENTIFNNPTGVLRNILDSTMVHSGSEKMIVRASPIGNNSKQAKVRPTLAAEVILWAVTRNQSRGLLARKLEQPVNNKISPNIAVCRPDLARNMSVRFRSKY